MENYKIKNNPLGDETIFIGFSKPRMMELLDRNNADGLRIYLARKNGSETVVCVLTNENPEGVITEIEYSNTQYGLNFGTLCPPGTGCNCDQNSLAKIVYGDLISYTPPAPQP
jgi:hypothetical protein